MLISLSDQVGNSACAIGFTVIAKHRAADIGFNLRFTGSAKTRLPIAGNVVVCITDCLLNLSLHIESTFNPVGEVACHLRLLLQRFNSAVAA